MFGIKKRNQPGTEGVVNNQIVQKVVYVDETEPRPCWVRGRKAIFHRWCNTANPVLPRGMKPEDERAHYFQHRSTTAIVEYMDGTVERVWPQDLEFADGGRFDEMTWLPRNQPEGE
jgi:hypothetical protein